MYEKIYKNLRFISMLALFLTAGTTLAICYTVLTRVLFIRVLAAVLVLALLIYILTIFVARRVTDNIVRPIEKGYDIENDDYEEVYDEIKPFVRRIARQNREIQAQMEELKEQMRLAGKAQQIRQEFTANVSHELKTPLTTIHGYAQILSAGIVKPEDVQNFASKIEKESSRLIVLIEDIIKLSHLDENVKPDDEGPVSMRAVAEEVAETLQIHAAEKNVSLEITGSDIHVQGSLSQLTELVYNLCDNGVKYNREGGCVRIELCPAVSAEKGEGRYIGYIKVADTGIGIPKEYSERIFERFFRVDKSRSQKVKGTGLGLSIVKHIAQVNGARIDVESREGEGTTFTVHFWEKVAETAPDEAESPADLAKSGASED